MQKDKYLDKNNHRRALGVHLTSSDIFLNYIFPTIENELCDYLWVDLFAGEGNLIFPLLDSIKEESRINFFKEHIFLSDIQEDMVIKCIKKAQKYGIPSEIARKNIIKRDNLQSYPPFLENKRFPIFHITNPPYLYLGYIRKHPETKKHLLYFERENEGYQDLYQIAMINDLRNEVNNLVYIIPSNFLFGSSVSNKFRSDFLYYYKINKMYIFETKIFEFTGTNILIGFFERKRTGKNEVINFEGIKFKKDERIIKRKYSLKPDYQFRAGSEFEEFLEKYRCKNPLKVNYYLQKKDLKHNDGDSDLLVIDTSCYASNEYLKKRLKVSKSLKEKVKSNILYVRTVDTGSYQGRVGLYNIHEDFGVEGIYVSGNTYRTSPIQIFIEPSISKKTQKTLRRFFNLILEHFREELDSEFLTTYKYSDAEYTRKYLGLTQTRKLIQTFPILDIIESDLEDLNKYIRQESIRELFSLLLDYT